MATKKEQVAFELENPGGFVTQADQIGMNGKPLDEAVPEVDNNQDSNLDIKDSESNIIAQFAGGHFRTQKFDSAQTPSQKNTSNSELEFCDENGNVIARFKNGHFKTQKFDSSVEVVKGIVYVKDCGAKGDGATDDTTALENAFAKAYKDGKAVVFTDGTYIIRRPLTLRSRMEIYGSGNATVRKRQSATTRLSQALSENAETMYVNSVQGFQVGDYICVSSLNSTYPAARHCSVGYIKSIDKTNNAITFKSAYDSLKKGAVKNHAVGCYVTNSCAIFRSWGMFYECNDVYIHNLTLDGNRQDGEFGDWMNGCVHIDATTGTIEGIAYSFPARNLTCRDLTIQNSPFDAISDQGDGGATIENCKIVNPYMHGVHFGTYYDGATVINNVFDSTANGAGVFWCQNVQNVVVSGNRFLNCKKGCSDYEYGTAQQNSMIIGNIFVGIKSYVFDFSKTTENFKGKIIMSNNIIEKVKAIVANLIGKDNVIISNNIVRDFTTTPAYLFNLEDAENIVLSGNIAPSIVTIYNGNPTNLKEFGNSWNN